MVASKPRTNTMCGRCVADSRLLGHGLNRDSQDWLDSQDLESRKSFNPENHGSERRGLLDQLEKECSDERGLEETGADNPADEFAFGFREF